MLKALQSFFNSAPAVEQTKQYHAEGLSDEAFLSLILMTEISLADGVLSNEERDYLLADLKNEYQLDGEAAENAVNKAAEAVKEAASLHDFTAPLKRSNTAKKCNYWKVYGLLPTLTMSWIRTKKQCFANYQTCCI